MSTLPDFHQNKHGVFTNPDCYEVPMPEGFRFLIEVAYAGGRWFYGFDVNRHGEGNRQPCKRLSATDQGNLSRWSAILTPAICTGRRYFKDSPAAAAAVEVFIVEMKDHEARGSYFPNSTQTDKPMTTVSTIETAAPAALELIINDWTATGVCVNPEIVTIPGMPAKASCEFHLGVTPERKLVARFVLKLNGKVEDNCGLVGQLDWNGILYESREEVVRKGLQRAAPLSILFEKSLGGNPKTLIIAAAMALGSSSYYFATVIFALNLLMLISIRHHNRVNRRLAALLPTL